MPALAVWLLPSAAAVLAAYIAQNAYSFRGHRNVHAQHALFVIGDLHGDAQCARHWVERTGLVQNGKWADASSSLIFVGDYVDKGPTSRQTIEYVKSLTDEFPQHVTALMGNHEMELLLDRDEDRHEVWGGVGFFQLSYASVHPGEYLNYLNELDDNDEIVVEALYNASIEVYGHGQHQSTFVLPDVEGKIRSILHFVPPKLRSLVKKRMEIYHKSYLDSFRSGTELGAWLEQRPVLANINGTLFVHGGISLEAASLIATDGIERINQLLADNAKEGNLNDFINTEKGRVIYDMLTFRGNHKEGACPYLPKLLPDGASRLGVGHTPDSSVRLLCDGNFLALDSALSRWFRNSGNEYCPGHREQFSSNGRYRCDKINEQCEGQIVRIRNDQVEILQ